MYHSQFIEISHDISVEVKPTYLEEESAPANNRHVFAYFITIRNMSSRPVQLLERHWEINDSDGDTYEIDGRGVIGVQPNIKSKQKYTYNSFCVLESYWGKMKGFYTMDRKNGEIINVRIPEFQLISHLLN